MTGPELATLATFLWVVGTVSLFILLAEWSSGGSWGLTSSIVHGMLGWAERDMRPTTDSSDLLPLRPILDPYAALRRDRRQAMSPVDVPPPDAAPDAEIVELGERRLPSR